MFFLLSTAFAQEPQLTQTPLPARPFRASFGFSGIEFPYSFASLNGQAEVLMPNVVYVRARGGYGLNFSSSKVSGSFLQRSGVGHAEAFVGWPRETGVGSWDEFMTLSDIDITETSDSTTYEATVLPIEVTATSYFVPQVGVKVFRGAPLDRLTVTDDDWTVVHGYVGFASMKRYREKAVLDFGEAGAITETVWGERSRAAYLVVGQGGRIPAFNNDNPHYKGGNPLPVGVWLEKTDTAQIGRRALFTLGGGFLPTQGVAFRFEMKWVGGMGA